MGASISHIAVIEDDAAIADSVKMVLESHQWSVQSFSSGEQFLGNFRAHAVPSCILLDFVLPGINGVDLLTSLAPLGRPVVVLTAYPALLSASRAHELGVRAILTKPVSAETLVDAIAAAVGAKPA